MSPNVLFFVFLVTLVGVSGENDGYSNMLDHYVIIGPPENLTVSFVGSTNIVILWDPPAVYKPYDVGNDSFLDTFKPGDELSVTRQEGILIAVNETDTGGVNATEDSNSTTSENNGTKTDSVTATPDNQNAATTTPSPWTCQPFSYFSNYTVAVKKELELNDSSMVISLKDSAYAMKKETVETKSEHSIVSYEKGCIIHHKVYWNKKDKPESLKSRVIPPTFRIANITGLKPGITYEVSVSAVFVGDAEKRMKSIFITTSRDEEKKVCKCDGLGTIDPSKCELKNGPSYCQCKVGYEGYFCESCSKGYYRTGPYFPCHRCPCDAHASKKTSCGFYENFLRCDECEVGYTGNICHQCAPGFYRHKRHCVMCHCNGNTPTGHENMCLPTTGMCINCQYNTTGFHCERCMPNYIGDAITHKNCTLKSEVLGVIKKSTHSSVSPGIIAAVILALILLALLVVGILFVRRYRFKERRRAFWTVEMKRDHDDVDFNTVGNDDAHMDDIDDMDFYDRQNKASSTNKYSRLDEQI